MEDLPPVGTGVSRKNASPSLDQGGPQASSSRGRWIMVGVWATLATALATFAAALITYWPN